MGPLIDIVFSGQTKSRWNISEKKLGKRVLIGIMSVDTKSFLQSFSLVSNGLTGYISVCSWLMSKNNELQIKLYICSHKITSDIKTNERESGFSGVLWKKQKLRAILNDIHQFLSLISSWNWILQTKTSPYSLCSKRLFTHQLAWSKEWSKTYAVSSHWGIFEILDKCSHIYN